jgi:hypothetical protein
MAGGTWTTQNKVRPGVYINFESEPKQLGAVGARGVISMALPLSWGESKTIMAIQAGEDVRSKLGYDLTHPKLLLVREALKRAKTLLLYRLNAGTKAAATLSGLTITAARSGVRGNDIAVVIEQNVDDPGTYTAKTLVDNAVVHQQIVSAVAGLKANDWIVFGSSGTLQATAGLPLTGGTDGSVTNADHSDYLQTLELQDFQTVALVSADAALKAVYAAFVKRLRQDEGHHVQAVLENYPAADYEGVVSVKNGVKLADGTTISAVQATAWVAGAIAGAQLSESLTYLAYEDTVDTNVRYTNTQIEAALRGGEFLFTPSGGKAVVEQDINTLTGFTVQKGKAYAKNRVIRILDGINNDMKRIFESFFIGKINNDASGRNLLRNECVSYLTMLQDINAIQSFDSKSDVAVVPGIDGDSVAIEVQVQPVDSVEKIYMKVQVV